MSEILQPVAIHEAGHAVLGRVLGLCCGGASIIPDGDENLGRAGIENPLLNWRRGDGRKRKLADSFCMALYAGGEAEKMICGSTGDQLNGQDADDAEACLKMIGVRGASYVGDDIWERHQRGLCYKAMDLVVKHRNKIERVAEALLERKTLTAEEIDNLVGA